VRIEKFYTHLNGYEWLKVRRVGFWEEIERTISSIDVERCRTKVSKEQRMLGKW
jgi:hypothetical protein